MAADQLQILNLTVFVNNRSKADGALNPSLLSKRRVSGFNSTDGAHHRDTQRPATCFGSRFGSHGLNSFLDPLIGEGSIAAILLERITKIGALADQQAIS